MTPEIYQAMKRRIEKITPEDSARYNAIHDDYTERSWNVPYGFPFYRFNPDGLNEGIDPDDDNYVEPLLQPMNTHNLWNVCGRFYSFIQFFEDIDTRLLQN